MTRVEQRTVFAAAVLLALALVGWYASAPPLEPMAPRRPSDINDVGVVAAESINEAARAVAETDPFRLERRPAAVAYRPDLENVSPPAPPPKPSLVLSGLVGGAALIDGAPGHPMTVIVRTGDTLGGLRIRRVGRDTVTVSGMDTTWRLTVRRSWQ